MRQHAASTGVVIPRHATLPLSICFPALRSPLPTDYGLRVYCDQGVLIYLLLMSSDPAGAPQSALTLRTYAKGEATVVECHGRLTSATAGILQSEVKPMLPRNTHVILDLTHLWQVDSMGLGTLIALYVSAKGAGCRLELIHLSKKVRELLGMTNLLSVFGVFAEDPHRMP
jgi:anti-sigma B factor antagonist